MNTKEYVILGSIVVLLFFVLVTLNKIEAPIEQMEKLPKCDNGVIITEDLKSNVVSFANNYISNGTGSDYFNNHYHFMTVEYSSIGCVFVVKYDYTYDELHTIMNIKVKAFSNKEFEVVDTNAFLRPVSLIVSKDEAVSLAKQNNISYDYYNLVIDIKSQTFVYKFYKNTLTEGDVDVFEIDGQSKEIRVIPHLPEEIPIV